ncbi:T7SS effector LXG polymorphic toxin [Clostridium felsineum]|uniref:T7SS effector LXG polymorphic toxin n=1 Tax=Clostridium felsineum TaxID=36839 RepID=UPI002033CBCA|nr:T7SS effector LXG polymorphic toxin [Clostridium felsineum]URZ18372.1 hypothetical protein CLFE_044420 [Clostridium felsineum DSM 794]
MSNTELYYDALTDLSVRIAAGIKNRTQPLDELNQAMTQLSQTDAIKGNAANAMKAYINEVHMTLIQTLELLLNNYEMTLGKYVKGYLEVDSSESFKLVKEDFDAHVRNLSSHRSDFTSIGDKLKAISDEAEDILSLGGAGSKRLFNVVSEMDSMKKTVSNLDDSWNKYENGYKEFDQVQDLIAQTKALLKSTLSVPRGYSYSAGSFSKLISKDFVNAFEANVKYAQNKDNQKEFKKDWDRICKDYTTDQKRMTEEKQKEANQHKGAWEVVFGVGAVVIGAAAIILTAGAATPLVAVAWTAGLSAGAYGVSNVFEGSQIMVTGADKAFNPLRDTIFQGNQGAYDTFGNVAVFVAGSVIPVGAALKAGQAVPRAIIAGVGRTTVTTAVGVGTNFVVAPIATSLAKSAGIDPVWANDIGTGTGFATSIFTAGKVYKGSGNLAKVVEVSDYENTLEPKLGKYVQDSFEGIGKEAQDNFNKYLRENIWCDETLSNAEKIDIMKANFDKLTPEQKINFNVSNEVKVLKNPNYSNWGEWPDIDWPDFPGLNKDTAKSVYNEATGKIEISSDLDRLGSPYGNNLGVVKDGYHCTQDERSICYIENEYARNGYKFDGTYYKDAIDAIKDFDIDNLEKPVNKINSIIEIQNKINGTNLSKVDAGDIVLWKDDYTKFQNNPNLIELCKEKGIDSTYGVMGKAEKWMVNGELITNGGAEQINTPVSVKTLEDIGLIKNIGGW